MSVKAHFCGHTVNIILEKGAEYGEKDKTADRCAAWHFGR